METTSVDSKYYVHDLDKAAFSALHAIPGFQQVTRAFLKVWHERQARVENMSTRVRINENQLREYYEMLPPICERLGIEVPEFYLELDVNPNAGSFGDTKPYVVMTSGLLETVPHELVPTVLAHECGHIACRHTLYRTMGSILLDTSSNALSSLLSSALFGLGELAVVPLQVAFYHWMRCSEYSADRAAVICDGTADKMSDVCMRLAGFDKDIVAEANKPEFLRQAQEYREMVKDSALDKTFEFLMLSYRTHPLMAVRALECEEWAAGDQFAHIMDGTYLEEPAPEDPLMLKEAAEEQPQKTADGTEGKGSGGGFKFPAMPQLPNIELPKMPWAAGEEESAGESHGGASLVASELREYKTLMDDGIITEDEFEAKKRQLLGLD